MATTHTIAGKEVELIHAYTEFAGYGHRKVAVELYYNWQYKKFAATTTRVDLVEEAEEMKYLEERYAALYSIIDTDIADEVSEWMQEHDAN